VIVPHRYVSTADWKPASNKCHENVSVWCCNNPTFKAARGWLYIDFGSVLPYEVFIAHSVVRDKDDALWDLTPMSASERYPFIEAVETEEDYAALIEAGASRLVHYK
jgi:hypothetical protein